MKNKRWFLNLLVRTTVILSLGVFCPFVYAGIGDLDENGWTIFTPSADTMIVYVSSSTGNDNWDGLVPEWDGTSGPKATLAAGYALMRDEYPDWLLLKRGDVWYERLSDNWKPDGRSASEPMLISSYGDSTERPLLKTGSAMGFNVGGGSSQDDEIHDLAIVGIHFYAHTRDPNNPSEFVSTSGTKSIRVDHWNAQNVLIEDNYLQSYTNLTFSVSIPMANLVLRRNIITDAYEEGPTHSQGVYVNHTDGLLIEENLFDHNGWDDVFPLHDRLTTPGKTEALEWGGINDGQFSITMALSGEDGRVTYHIDGVDFSSVSSMEEVASVIMGAVNDEVVDPVDEIGVTWDSSLGLLVFIRTGSGARIESITEYVGSEGGTPIHGADWINGPGVYTYATKFNHNLYIQKTSSNITVRGNIISRASSHGVQLRPGGVIEDNLFLRNPIHLFTARNTGIVRNNVLLGSADISGGQRGGGITTFPSHNAIVENNIIAHKDDSFGPWEAINVRWKEDDGATPYYVLPEEYDVIVDNNIVYNWYSGSSNALLEIDAAEYNTVQVSNNVLQDFLYNASMQIHHVSLKPGISYSGNSYYGVREPADQFQIDSQSYDFAGWVTASSETGAMYEPVQFLDPNRTIATYQAFLGSGPTFEAFIEEAKLQSKSNWRQEYTAQSVNEYIREGFRVVTDSGDIIYGDVSGDNEISAYDASLAAQHAVSLIHLSNFQIQAAEVSGSGGVSAYDASLIAQRAVGLITEFPVEEP